MPSTRFSATVLGCYDSTITLHMSPTAEGFYLSQITIDLNPDTNGFDGCWARGNARHGGSRSVEVGQADFDRLHAECPTGATVTVTITYHDSPSGNGEVCIDDMDCVQATLTAALMRITHQLGDGGVLGLLTRSNELAEQQLQMQKETLELLREARTVAGVQGPGPAPRARA
ncbi:MAG: hypothetical protein ABI488_25770 [Polyangiaceae bacterium]